MAAPQPPVSSKGGKALAQLGMCSWCAGSSAVSRGTCATLCLCNTRPCVPSSS